MPFYYPPGIILPFDTSCPTGWTRVSALDAKFLKGNDTFGGIGGSSDHRHNIDYGTVYSGYATGSGVDAASGSNIQKSVEQAHRHFYTNYSAYSNYVDNYPPYINVVFCTKD